MTGMIRMARMNGMIVMTRMTRMVGMTGIAQSEKSDRLGPKLGVHIIKYYGIICGGHECKQTWQKARKMFQWG